MDIYVVSVVHDNAIRKQEVYNNIETAVEGLICEMYHIAENTDMISFRRVKELENEMRLSSRTEDPSYHYLVAGYLLYIRMYNKEW